MALNDLHFASDRPAPWLTGFALVAAVGMAAFGMFKPDAFMFAILLGAMAVAFWKTDPPGVDGSADSEGLVLSRPSAFIAYEEVRGIESGFDPYEPAPSFEIRVHHHRGILTIPAAPTSTRRGSSRP